MNSFQFASPYWFYLTPILLLVGIVDGWRRNKRKPSIAFSTTAPLTTIPRGIAARVKKYVPLLFYFGALCVVVALARPQLGVSRSRALGNGISIIMCVDRSGSMAAEDFEIDGAPTSRLKAVKKVFKEFVEGSKDFKGRPNDLIGLIAFGGFVDSHCPLTLDHASLVEILDTIETPRPLYDARGNVVRTRVIDEESGTAIGDALAAAVERIKESSNKTKIIVLLSDGMQTVGALSPEEGIKVAQAYGVKVYTIGVGSSGFAPFPHYLPGGDVVMMRQNLDFNPEALQTIADATGGRYFFAGDVDSLKSVYEEIDRLERTKFEAGSYAEYRDIYAPFLIAGLFFLTLNVVLVATRFRSFP